MPGAIDSYNSTVTNTDLLGNVNDVQKSESIVSTLKTNFLSELSLKDGKFSCFLSEKPSLAEPNTKDKSISTINMLSEDALMTMLGFENSKSQIKSAQSTLKTNAQIRKLENDNLIDKLQEQAKKIEENAKLSGIKKFFKILGAVFGVIAGIAACVASGGSSLAIAGLVIGSLLATESIVSEATDGKVSLTALCTEVFGEKAGPWVSFGLQLALTLTSIGFSIGGAKGAVDGINKVAKLTSQIANASNSLTTIASSSLDIASSVNQKEINSLKADQKVIQALMYALMAEDEQSVKRLEELLEHSRGNAEKVKEIVDELNEVTTAAVTA